MHQQQPTTPNDNDRTAAARGRSAPSSPPPACAPGGPARHPGAETPAGARGHRTGSSSTTGADCVCVRPCVRVCACVLLIFAHPPLTRRQRFPSVDCVYACLRVCVCFTNVHRPMKEKAFLVWTVCMCVCVCLTNLHRPMKEKAQIQP